MAGWKSWFRRRWRRSRRARPATGRPRSENPYGAWYWKTDIRTGSDGLLSGKKVAIKDNICVAGVPMMNGSALLEGYVPDSTPPW